MNEIEMKAQEIIKDLLLLDPDLKNIEVELNKLVINFINNKPNVIINEEFKEALKIKIMKEAQVLKEECEAKKIVFDKRVFIRKLSFSFAALALAVIIIFPGINLIKGNTSFLDINTQRNKEISISKLEDGVFGILASRDFPLREENRALLNGHSLMTLDLNDSEITKYKETLSPQFKYVYEGDDLLSIVPQTEKIDIYKRDKMSFNNLSTLNSITSLLNKSINLKKFKNNKTKITRVNLSEDKDFGYDINLNFAQGSLFLSQNRDKWPQAGAQCEDEACYLANQFKYDELLSNEESIAIAEEFLLNLGVNKNNYAEAVINYDFHEVYKNSENKKDLYIPEETIITFPFIIDGKEVKDENANPYGLIVSVNSRYKKVTELSNFYFSNFESSAYEAIRDTDLIKKIVEQGGRDVYQLPSNSNEIEEIIISLGTPSLILSKQDMTNDGYENSEELFIPALSFPVLELSRKTDLFTKKYIIIPLVKELIENNN